MTNREIALKYLSCFCAGDIEELQQLLAPHLKFSGTLHSYSSRVEYLDSLNNDSPGKCDYKLLSIAENDDSVAVFYDYKKPDQIVHIAQLFTISDQKIQEILLIFDGRCISQDSSSAGS